MKRKIMVLAASAAVLFAAVYGTLAYFSAAGRTSNVITAGNIKMALHQETADGRSCAEAICGLMPGQSVDRVVYVENTGDNALYARIKLTPSARAKDGAVLSFGPVSLDIDTTKWKLGEDGWYYYQSALEKGGKSEPLFKEIRFAADMGNDYMDASVSIGVSAQAVQCANNGGTVWQAAGWPSDLKG